MAAIDFPANPLSPTDHSVTPWTDTNTGQRWLWYVRSVGKGKWGRATAGITKAYYEGPTPPVDRSLPWYDTTDQSWNTFDTDSDTWVMTSGVPGARGARGTDAMLRATQTHVPVELQVISIPDGTDTTIFLNPAGNLTRLDFEFPAGVDGQTVLLVPPGTGMITIGAVLIWPDVGTTGMTLNAGNTYAFVYAAEANQWQAL